MKFRFCGFAIVVIAATVVCFWFCNFPIVKTRSFFLEDRPRDAGEPLI